MVIETGVLDPVIKTGYFPTPANIVNKMVDLAMLSPEQLILEPSAGQGHIADLIANDINACHSDIAVCETLPENVHILQEKGYKV